jgi:hypothetical protein
LLVKGSFEEEAEERVLVRREDRGLGVCECGHYCEGGAEKDLEIISLNSRGIDAALLTGEEEIEVIANDLIIALRGRIERGADFGIVEGG